MIDEDDLQRRELKRLLNSTTNEERKEVILQTLKSLEQGESQATSPVPLQVSHLKQSEKIMMRPASARRRPSISCLDSIPESDSISSHPDYSNSLSDSTNTSNISQYLTSYPVQNNPQFNPTIQKQNQRFRQTEEMILPYDDVSDVICSSNDLRYNPKTIFRTNPSLFSSPQHHGHGQSHGQSSGLQRSWSRSSNMFPSSRGSWISTGLVPQFVYVNFYEKWTIRRVEVQTIAVEEISFHINYSAATSFSTNKLIKMDKATDKEKNYFQIEVINNAVSNSTRSSSSSSIKGADEDRLGVSALGFTLVISKASDIFFGIKSIKVTVASPH